MFLVNARSTQKKCRKWVTTWRSTTSYHRLIAARSLLRSQTTILIASADKFMQTLAEKYSKEMKMVRRTSVSFMKWLMVSVWFTDNKHSRLERSLFFPFLLSFFFYREVVSLVESIEEIEEKRKRFRVISIVSSKIVSSGVSMNN